MMKAFDLGALGAPRSTTQWVGKLSCRSIGIAMACLLSFQAATAREALALGVKHDPATPRITDPGHLKMIRLLKRVERETRARHPYLGSRNAEILSQQVIAMDDTVPVERRWKLYQSAGVAELEQGHERKGVEMLSKAVSLLDELGPAVSIEAKLKTMYLLGMGYMRLGETQNCCARNTADSCLLPIQGGGRHGDPEGSENAIRVFRKLLDVPTQPSFGRLRAQWLMNIAYMTLGQYPQDVPERLLIPPQAFESDVDFPRFPNIAHALGVDSFGLAGGAIIDDFDGDDYLDIFTTNWNTSGEPHFFKNNRDGTFSDRTEQAGLTGLLGGLNMVQADYDNDGDLDVLILRGAWAGKGGRHPNSLLRNNGDGTFTDVTFKAGLGKVHYPTQVAGWADYDNDGLIDLFVGNETNSSIRAPCQLFHNMGDGTFTDVADSAGVKTFGFVKGATWGDFNEDQLPDLYVSNLGQANCLYRNNGDGTFTDVADQLGVSKPISSFPVWFWDFDNDGALDLFVSTYAGEMACVAAHHLGRELPFEPLCLYRGDGAGGFEEVAWHTNLTYPILPMGSNYGDLNNDGFLDFYLGTGDPSFDSLMPNLMFLNMAGKRFANISTIGGFAHLQKGHGVSFADLDNDGDLDVFEVMGGAFPGDGFFDTLYENPGFGNHWITVKLVGTASNRAAIGARIHVRVTEDQKARSIYRYVTSGGSFGANPLRQTIGLGSASKVDRIEVFWPVTGHTQVLNNIPCDRSIRIVEGVDGFTVTSLKTLQLKGGAASTFSSKPDP